MRAVILAGGRGRRLGGLTDDLPKPLLRVAGRPIIIHVLDALLAAGVRDVVIITGYRGDMIEAELGNGMASGAAMTYVRQEQIDGTARALLLARDFAGHAPFFLASADVVTAPANFRRIIRASRLTGCSIAVDRYEGSGTHAVYVDEPSGDGRVERIAPTLPADESATAWRPVGLGVLPPAIWPHLDAAVPSPSGEYDVLSAIKALVDDDETVRAVPVEGPCIHITTPESLTQARATFESAS